MIPVNQPLLNGNEKKYLNECIDGGWISSGGPFVKRFEDEFAKKIGKKYGVAVSNGSTALDTACIALNLKKGDEVIMPSFTIICCASAITRTGAKPVLIDADSSTWNMKTEDIETKITKNTKAIMVVHIYGIPVNMKPIIKLAKQYNLKIIEDNAEEIGQTCDGKMCGSFGDISIFSFYPNKHITTGEGGMILTDDFEVAEKCRSLRNLCFLPDGDKRFIHEDLGYNYRLTNLQAALGVAQLERLDEFVGIKHRIGKLYNQLLNDLQEYIQLPLTNTEYAENIYWVYGIVIRPTVNIDANEAINKLKEIGIECRPFFYPMHSQPALKKLGLFENESYPIADNLYKKGFYIPSGLGISDEQIKKVSACLHKIFC